MVTIRRKFSVSSVGKSVPVPWELIDNYSQDSTIHGMKYLGGKKQHWAERIFWILIFVVSITFCVKNMKEIYERRSEKPVMVSLAKHLTPTFDIPFPAVTICPEIKAKCDKINLTDLINQNHSKDDYSKDEIERVAALSHVCDTNFYDDNVKKISTMTTDAVDVIKNLEEMSFTANDIFEKCRYSSWKFENCKKYFVKTLTDNGICFTFNMLNFDDYINVNATHTDLHYPKHDNKSSWFLDKDYNTDEMNVYPRRVVGSGLQSGLSVKLKFNSSMLCPSCLSGIRGFRVSLHMPIESPEISNKFYNIPFNRETNLIVKPSMIYSSKDIKNYLPEKRMCYFNHERTLKYFKIYSRTNCHLECKADYVERACGCVKFSMPRTNDTVVCGNSQLECVYKAEIDYMNQDLMRKLMKKQLKRDIKQGKATKKDARMKALEQMTSCECLQSCTSITYDAEVSQTDYDVVMDGYLVASLNIYFKDAHFSRLKRYEIYGWTDFLSNSGGILGLFMGCSVLSFIEIVYHIVLYCFKKCRSHRKNSNDPYDVPM